MRALLACILAFAPAGYREAYGAALSADLERIRAARGAFAALGALFDIAGAVILERIAAFGDVFAAAVRGLSRTPGFTTIAAATLAVAIAANVAVFTVLDSVALRPLPFPQADRLVDVHASNTATGAADFMSIPDADDILAQSRSIERAAVFTAAFPLTLAGVGTPRKISGALVSTDFFATLESVPQLGRLLQPGDEKLHVVVISDRLWRTVFAADPGIVGRTIQLSGTPTTVVGVTQPGYISAYTYAYGGVNADFYGVVPHNLAPRPTRLAFMYARLRPGTSIVAARTELAAIGARLARAYPLSNKNITFAAVPAIDTVAGSIRPMLELIWLGVLVVALIACANVGNMLLARATVREREISIRLAIGATRCSVLASFIAESAMLATSAAALGLVGAWFGVHALIGLAPRSFPRISEIGFAPDVLVFTLVLVGAVTLLCGVVPGLVYARKENGDALRDGVRGSSSARGAGLRNAIVACEIALTLALSVDAALVVRSFVQLTRVDTGFRPDGIAVFAGPQFFGSEPAALEKRRSAFFDTLSTRLAALPGVKGVAYASTIPLSGDGLGTDVVLDGRDIPNPADRPVARVAIVSPEFFALLGITMRTGRAFDQNDERRPSAAIIDQTLERRLTGGASAIGRRILTDIADPNRVRTIVGVVRDVRLTRLSAPSAGTLYLVGYHPQWITSQVFVKTSATSAQLASAVESIYRGIDPTIPPPTEYQTLDAVAAEDASGSRFIALIFGVLGFIAIAIALAGVYGVMSYDVARRTREIGIRMALGVPASAIFRATLRRAAIVTGLGIAGGLIVAAFAARAIGSLLFETTPFDVPTFAGVTLLIVLCTQLAAYLPARRATRIDPIRALRFE